MTGREFFKMCADFDWYFQFSDDMYVWKDGMNREIELRDIKRDISTPYWYEYIFDSWQNYANSHINPLHFGGQTLEVPKEEVFEDFFKAEEKGKEEEQ